METREELLNGLQRVKELINQILSAYDRQVDIVAQFRQEQARIETTGVANQGKLVGIGLGIMFTLFYAFIALFTGQLFLVVLGLACVAVIYFERGKKSKLKVAAFAFLTIAGAYLLYQVITLALAGDVVWLVILIIMAAIGVAAMMFVIKKKNAQIDAANAKIAAHNAEVQKAYDKTVEDINRGKVELQKFAGGWYPPSYYGLEAVNFFINAVVNGRADTMKEAVNLFEDTKYKDEMRASMARLEEMNRQQLINQEEMKRQLRISNILNAANLALQADTAKAVRENTAQVRSSGDQISGAVSDAAKRVESAIGRLKR